GTEREMNILKGQQGWRHDDFTVQPADIAGNLARRYSIASRSGRRRRFGKRIHTTGIDRDARRRGAIRTGSRGRRRPSRLVANVVSGATLYRQGARLLQGSADRRDVPLLRGSATDRR